MSEFKVEVVRIGEVVKHPHADSLSIVQVHGGYPCIIKTGDFAAGALAVYVPVDALVPVARPEFAFLAATGKARAMERIKARRLRGIFSMGVLVAAPAGTVEGQDVRELMGVEKWEPEAERETVARPHENTRKARNNEMRRVELISMVVACAVCVVVNLVVALTLGPGWTALAVIAAAVIVLSVARGLFLFWFSARFRVPNVPTYDIEGIRKHKCVLLEGEDVWITEKIHGCNGLWLHTGKRFWARSRTVYRFDASNVWSRVAEQYGLSAKLAAHPGVALLGEVYGSVQDLHYGVPAGEVRVAFFDAMETKTRRFYDVEEFQSFARGLDLPVVPTLYRGSWSESLLALAEGDSVLPGAGHVREGIVIKPVRERFAHSLGRVVLKLAGEGYLLRNGG
jgi:tRNA-binding EMAP/Myf-like protein